MVSLLSNYTPIYKLVFLALYLLVCSKAGFANPLLERNLPNGELLYTDGVNEYYGVFLNDSFENLPGLDVTDKDAALRVVAFRKAQPDGTLVHFEPVTVKDYFGKPIEGKRYHNSEVELINQHIIGVIDKKYANRKDKNYLRVLIYAKGEFFAGTPARGQFKNAPLEAPESWVTVLNFSRENAHTPMRPAYESRGNTGLPKNRFVAGIQDLSRKKLPNSIASQRLKRNTALLAAEPAKETITNKQVVKPQEFWDRLQFSGTVKEVFEGDFSSVTSDTFKVYYSAMQWAYSDNCKHLLPANSVKRGYILQQVHSGGSRDTILERSAYIAPKYIGVYDGYAEDVSRVMGQTKRTLQSQANTAISRGGGLVKMLNTAVSNEPIHQLNRFIDASDGCESSAVYQLRENYLRAALGLPSLQAANVELPNAINESAPLPPSLYGACMNTSDATKKYCLCFEREALTVLTKTEKQLFESDLDEFYKVVRRINTQPSPPSSDRAWALSEIIGRCN